MAILGIKGPTEHDLVAEETGEIRQRTEATRKLSLGGGLSVGAMVCFGAFEVLRANPHEAFPLLESWGPRVIFGLLGLYVLYDLAKMVLNQTIRLVHAVERLAVAQQKSADKDDRAYMEMQTLTTITARRGERTEAIQQRYHDENQESQRKLAEMIVDENRRTRHEFRNSLQDLADGRYVRLIAKGTEGEKQTL